VARVLAIQGRYVDPFPIYPRHCHFARSGRDRNFVIAVMASWRNKMRKGDERWIGPFPIKELLARCLDHRFPRPPESDSCYLITQRQWKKSPTQKSLPLYVGGTTGNSKRFRTRVGDLLADAFGFFGSETGHSSGGHHLHDWCYKNKVNPSRLYIAWIKKAKCHRCSEFALYRDLKPKLNRYTPPACPVHK